MRTFLRSLGLSGAVALLCVGPTSGQALAQGTPLGLDIYLPSPADNRLTSEKVSLGEALFFDSILSADGTLACAGCHMPENAFSDVLRTSLGVNGRPGRRNAPSLLNRGYLDRLFWDGRAKSLEEAVLMPISNPAELGITMPELIERLDGDARYRQAFREAFGESPSEAGVARALASYVRSLRSGNAPLDRFVLQDSTALSEEAKRGRLLFKGRAECWTCHSGPLLSDGDLHNTGVSWGSPDTGVHLRSGLEADRGKFRTAPLRDVALTAPYMHDGSVATLEEVVEFYASGGAPNELLDPRVQTIRALELTAREKAALVVFLESLTGRR